MGVRSKLQVSIPLAIACSTSLGCDPAIFAEQIPDHILDQISDSSKLPEITECIGLSETQCKAAPTCQMTQGQELNFDLKCKSEQKVAGCTSMNCGDGALSFAMDWFGSSWLFPSTCHPDGWFPIEYAQRAEASEWPICPAAPEDAPKDNAEPGQPGSCEGLSDSICKVTEGCQVIEGTRLNLEKQCGFPFESAGCTSMDCGDGAILFAEDPQSSIWLFPTACYPDRWKELDPAKQELTSDAFGWPECSDQAGITALAR